jgi:DNA-binding NtrC family response regulator
MFSSDSRIGDRFVLDGDDVPAASSPLEADAGEQPLGRELTLAELRRAHILAVLKRVDGNRTRAAELLGLPRRTLYRRLEQYGMLEEI